MNVHAAQEISLDETVRCFVERGGAIVLEGKSPSEAGADTAGLHPYAAPLCWVGLAAGPLSEWLLRGLTEHQFGTVLMETRQCPSGPLGEDRQDRP